MTNHDRIRVRWAGVATGCIGVAALIGQLFNTDGLNIATLVQALVRGLGILFAAGAIAGPVRVNKVLKFFGVVSPSREQRR